MYELTGEPFVATLPGERSVYDAVQIGVDIDYALLDERIEAGYRPDVASSASSTRCGPSRRRGCATGLTARRALGYAQVLKMLDGRLTEEQAKAETAQTTRRFARKQRSWFKRDPGITWLPAGEHLQTWRWTA